jgi:outer membrane protein TolC
MLRSTLTALLFVLAATSAAAQGLPAPSSETGWREALTSAVRRAAARNPRVREAEARAEAARQRVPQAAALPDPEVELGLKDLPVHDLSLSRDNFTMEMVTGRQRLPGRGKRSAQLAVARAGVEGAEAMREHELVDIAADTADAFFELAATDRGLAILEESRQRLEGATAAATELYRVGKVGQSDVLQASLEKTSLEEQLSSLRAARRAQAARFNALQGLPAGTPVPPIGPISPAGLGAEAPALADLARRAAERSHAVAAAQADVHRGEQELELALLEGRPDWTLMGLLRAPRAL